MCKCLMARPFFCNRATGHYFGLDQVGTNMWKALLATGSVPATIECLQREYAVDASRLERDVNELVGKLLAHGLVVVHAA